METGWPSRIFRISRVLPSDELDGGVVRPMVLQVTRSLSRSRSTGMNTDGVGAQAGCWISTPSWSMGERS